MYINKITKLKNDKYKIELDSHELITYSDVIIKYNLLYKKTIDDKLYKKIIDESKYYDVYTKCLKSLIKSRKSEKEVNEYLIKLEVELTDRKSIIDKLKNIRLIDDIEYTKSYINDKILLLKKGKNKIRNELRNKGISDDIINRELNNIDMTIFNNNLKKIIDKKIKTNKNYSIVYLKQKLVNDLINEGYEKDAIIDIISNYDINDDEILNKEYNKLFNKLSKKYNGVELTNKIKQKLLIKGFKSDDINNLINKKTEE